MTCSIFLLAKYFSKNSLFILKVVLLSLFALLSFSLKEKKVFKKAPLHHHFEELGWEEIDIVKLFWTIGFLLSMIGVIYGVWL